MFFFGEKRERISINAQRADIFASGLVCLKRQVVFLTQNSKKLEDVAIDISDVIYSAKIWEKAGIASLVNGYSYTEIRPKLLFKGQNTRVEIFPRLLPKTN